MTHELVLGKRTVVNSGWEWRETDKFYSSDWRSLECTCSLNHNECHHAVMICETSSSLLWKYFCRPNSLQRSKVDAQVILKRIMEEYPTIFFILVFWYLNNWLQFLSLVNFGNDRYFETVVELLTKTWSKRILKVTWKSTKLSSSVKVDRVTFAIETHRTGL